VTVVVELACANYVACFGSNEIEDGPDLGNGMFFRNSRVRIGDITDGTSNTLAVGERTFKRHPSTWVGAVPGAEESQAMVLGLADHTPNYMLDPHAEDFTSNHTRVCLFLMGDGSVRSISNTINLVTFRALATRSGGEVVGNF
jgi:hypothetical protein